MSASRGRPSLGVVEADDATAIPRNGTKHEVDLARLGTSREAVRTAPGVVGLLELPSTRFIELSARARELLGPNADVGLGFLPSNLRVEAAAIARAAAAGVIDADEAHGHLWHRPDGSVVVVMVRAQVIRPEGSSFGAWVARVLSRPIADSAPGAWGDGDARPVEDSSPASDAPAPLEARRLVSRLTNGSAHLRELLGEGLPLAAVTHPDDMGRLLFAFADATTHLAATARVRLLAGCGSIAADLDVARVGDSPWPVGLSPVLGTGTGTGDHRRKVTTEPQRLDGAAMHSSRPRRHA